MLRQRFPCCDRDGHDERSGSRQKVVVSRQDFMEWCRNRVFYAATEFWPRPKVSCHDSIFLGHDRVDQAKSFFYRDIMFLCRDRVWPNGEVLCCDRAILYCDRAILCCDIIGQVGKIFCRD